MTDPANPDSWYNQNSDWLVPAAGAVVGLASQIGGQKRSKKQQKQQNLYNLDQWNRTNEYNSPQAQMKRYMEAGLNPNLIYGSGNASSGNAAPAPEMAKISEVNYQPLDTSGALNTLQSFTDWDIKKAQSNNLESQTTKNLQGAALDAVRMAGGLTDNARSALELRKAKTLEQNSYDVANAGLQKTLADTKFTLNQDERAAIQNDISFRESIFKIAVMKLGMEQTKLLMRGQGFENQVKELDAYFASQGIRPTDPFYARVAAQLVDKGSQLSNIQNAPSDFGKWTEQKSNQLKDWYYKDKYKSKYPNLYPKK